MTITLSEAARLMGEIGGSAKGPSKSRPGVAKAYWASPAGIAMKERIRIKRAAKAAAQKAPQPGIAKAEFFATYFPHRLESVEWKVKWPVPHGDFQTYNPDYWCEALKCYIEVTTSEPNISEQGPAWRKAIQMGYPLRVYWWEGQEVTKDIIEGKRPTCTWRKRKSLAKSCKQLA